jgi:hypothetical protein
MMGIREGRPLLGEPPEPAIEQLVEPLDIVGAHLVDNEDDDQFWAILRQAGVTTGHHHDEEKREGDSH